MPFTDEQVATINKHLKSFGPSSCPFCKGEKWALHPSLTALCAQQKNGVNLFKSLQAVQLICETCGHIISYDADKIGVSTTIDLKAK